MGLCRSKDHNKDVALGGMKEGNVQIFKQSTLSLLVLSLIALFSSISFDLCGPLPKIHPDPATRMLENRNDVGKGVSLILSGICKGVCDEQGVL